MNGLKVMVVAFAFVLVVLFSVVVTKGCAVINRTTNADRIIYNYEWFQSTYNAIQGVEQQIRDKESLIAVMQADTKNSNQYDMQKLQIELTGLKTMRTNYISEYNAKASQVNRSIWKSSSVPTHINY